jgi:hypothetical protein
MGLLPNGPIWRHELVTPSWPEWDRISSDA